MALRALGNWHSGWLLFAAQKGGLWAASGLFAELIRATA